MFLLLLAIKLEVEGIFNWTRVYNNGIKEQDKRNPSLSYLMLYLLYGCFVIWEAYNSLASEFNHRNVYQSCPLYVKLIKNAKEKTFQFLNTSLSRKRTPRQSFAIRWLW